MWWTISVGIFCLAIVLIVSGTLYQFISSKIDESSYPHTGKLVDIGGFRLHINCTGEGGPAVILDSGLGGNSLEWSLVQPEIAKFTHVCSYDRAGQGWSDESPLARTSQNIVDELHRLLHTAEVPEPYILVGHSSGGINMRLYASRYPNEVAGVVLVDSAHEDQLKKIPITLPNKTVELFLGYIGYNRIRLLQYLPQIKESLKPFPNDIQEMLLTKISTTKFNRTALEELFSLKESSEQLKKAGGFLGDKPLIVISARKYPNSEETGESQESLNKELRIFKDLQKDLATKSTQGKQVFAEHSGHMITREQPEIIVESVQEIVNVINKKNTSIEKKEK
jgi:pimeloyl-ACP methyl ester carboxylesterase